MNLKSKELESTVKSLSIEQINALVKLFNAIQSAESRFFFNDDFEIMNKELEIFDKPLNEMAYKLHDLIKYIAKVKKE